MYPSSLKMMYQNPGWKWKWSRRLRGGSPARILGLFDFAQVLGKLSLSLLMLKLLDPSVLLDNALAHIKIIFFRERSIRGRETPVGLSAGVILIVCCGGCTQTLPMLNYFYPRNHLMPPPR
jgi:hypothetical protein